MIPIDEKEIRGITIKQGVIFLLGLISIIGSVVWTYSKTINAIEKTQESTEVLKVSIETLRIELKIVQTNQITTDLRLTKLETQKEDSEKK